MVIKNSTSSSSSSEVVWIGAGETKLINTPKHLEHKTNVCFFQKCIIGPHTLCVGDHILVSNADSNQPDSIEGCDIGRILNLYEIREISDRDPYRAYVQWYSWPNRIPNKAYDSDDISIDFDLEIIEEHRPYDADISLETVFGKCLVLQGDPKDAAETILNLYKKTTKKISNCPMFVCRYKFIKDANKKSYRLVPLSFFEEKDDKEKSSTNKKLTTRRQSCVGGIESVVTKSGGSHSARKSKRSIKNRRASVAVEFVDINSVCKENKVSPIKIIGGRSIVRLTASEKKNKSEINQKQREVNDNYLMASPLTEQNVKVTPTSRASAARRNLNLSLGEDVNTTNDSECLNYSIVNTSCNEQVQEPSSNIKIKLRLSEQRRSRRLESVDEDPLSVGENTYAQRQRKRLGIAENITPIGNDIYHTPSKRAKELETQLATPTNRRKSILKSGSRIRDENTPRRSIQLSNVVEKRIFQEDEIISTPRRNPSKRSNNEADDEYTPKKFVHKTPTRAKNCNSHSKNADDRSPQHMTPSAKLKLLRSGQITPSIKERQSVSNSRSTKSELQLAREQLHVSVVPQSLPCREKEFDNIYNFLESKIQDQCGGCMYVSGVPGTGKTATVTGVIRTLQKEVTEERLPEFEFLEINGMRLTEPRQAYVQIYKQLTGKTASWEHAHSLLEKRFTTPAPRRLTTVLLVDELDILCNRRQDVVYNLLDWPTKSAARLVVITIANTMDLPERLLMGKVQSRLGLTRLTFQPYTHKQLQEIVTARLTGSEAFKSDAVQLVARKVAAVSGDARRALDICRRSTEIADSSAPNADGQKVVSMQHVQQALSEMIASAKVQAIKNCSRLEQTFLQAVAAEVNRTGVEETSFMGVYSQIESIAAFMGLSVPAPGRALRICSKLGAERLIICEHSRNDIFQKILLNVSMDDIHYALRVNNNGN